MIVGETHVTMVGCDSTGMSVLENKDGHAKIGTTLRQGQGEYR